MESIKKNGAKPLFDRSILATFALVSTIGLFVSGYKFFTYKDCSVVNFVVDEDQMVTGSLILFKDRTPEATEWEWSFGDGTPPIKDKDALHVYKHPGEYMITLKVDGACSVRKKITIRKSKPVVDIKQFPTFSMPSTARVGEQVTFIDTTAGAEEWKWSFGETMQVDATTKDPTYTYQSSGTKTVTLIVNGNKRYATKKRLTVLVKPVKKPKFNLKPRKRVEIKKELHPKISVSKIPVVPPITPIQENKAPEINRIQLENYLLQVSEKKRKPESLIPFTCDGYGTRVRANGKEQTLQALLQNFKGEKVTIENLEVLKHKKTRCIDFIKINYELKKRLGIF